jgi:hypothetical protein
VHLQQFAGLEYWKKEQYGNSLPEKCSKVEMNLAESKSWVSLAGPIKEAVMNCDTNAPITNVATVCTNQHCLVMFREVTPIEFKVIESSKKL